MRTLAPSGILAIMFRRSKLALGLWILAIALVAVRISGVHLHLCSDGQEAPVSVHILDAPGHHGDAVQHGIDDHEDRDIDVSLSGAALFKKSDVGADLVPLIAFFILLVLLPRVATFLPRSSAPALPFGHSAYFRPPLRGPPL